MDDKVKVAVRLRPLNRRERELNTSCIVEMEDQNTILNPVTILPSSAAGGNVKKNAKIFAFDHCFWSVDPQDSRFANQEYVFHCLGEDLLSRAFEGYNACIFAYGQTGSGKSYTMMGSNSAEERGIIPRLCDTLFSRIDDLSNSNGVMDLCTKTACQVEVSYMEIYNEKVHDLLHAGGHKKNLRVREHSIFGPYVDGLSKVVVNRFVDIESHMTEGNKSRTVAATNMNSESSRSHAVFSIVLTQTVTDRESGVSGEKVSKISLVDLAGSERAQKTGAVGDRLKEGSNINKSLITLGLVIRALAEDGGGGGGGGGKRKRHVPYRDSTLTWLLKDSLGGNSKTVMVATLSPAGDNYEETLSTLRYADQAKRIVNHAVVNEDSNAAQIRELRQEVEELKRQLEAARMAHSGSDFDLKDKLEESEKLVREMSKTWEEKLVETERIHKSRHEALEKMGVSVQASGIAIRDAVYLVNMNSDPSLNELLLYYLKPNTLVGSADDCDIQLQGLGILPHHVRLELEADNRRVFLTACQEGSRTLVNGTRLPLTKLELHHSDRLLLGMNHLFRLNCPRIDSLLVSSSSSSNKLEDSSCNAGGEERSFDYSDAQAEVLRSELVNDPISQALCDLERHHEMDKEEALNRQRQTYESHLQQIKHQLIASSPMANSWMAGLSTSFGPQTYFDLQQQQQAAVAAAALQRFDSETHLQWEEERERILRLCLASLRARVSKAQTLCREANFLASEMDVGTEYCVTLRIPVESLRPDSTKSRSGAVICEPAIIVKRSDVPNQTWSIDKFQAKIIDMRDIYEERKERGLPLRLELNEVIYLSCSSSSSEKENEKNVVNKRDACYSSESWSTVAAATNGERQLHEYMSSCTTNNNPFFETQESHSLIGVANIFLDCLFYDNCYLDYAVPIINQHGECAGKLRIQLGRIAGSLPSEYLNDGETASSQPNESFIKIRLRILEARGVPPDLSHFVFCQYQACGDRDGMQVVAPAMLPNHTRRKGDIVSIAFKYQRDMLLPVNEDLLEWCSEASLSVEVYGNRSAGFRASEPGAVQDARAQLDAVRDRRSLGDRWSELCRKLEMWLSIQELGDQGSYHPVEVTDQDSVATGGVYQLRHGQSRRIMIRLRVAGRDSGTLPLIADRIQAVHIGCVMARPRALQRGLDSYQEGDLDAIRRQWSSAIDARQKHLDRQLQQLANKAQRSKSEEDRLNSLNAQWLRMTSEKEAVLVPRAGSGVPGAPASTAWHPPSGMEMHIPVLFLDMTTEQMAAGTPRGGIGGAVLKTVGLNATLLKEEHDCHYVTVPIVKHFDKETAAVCQWDSSLHESLYLNRVTDNRERVYLIVKVFLRLCHPTLVDVVLRKRICVNLYKRQSLSGILIRKMGKYVSYAEDALTETGVTYQLVSSIPQASLEVEDRESLARLAVAEDGQTLASPSQNGGDSNLATCDAATAADATKSVAAADGPAETIENSRSSSYIEKYLQAVRLVEDMLTWERQCQEVKVKQMASHNSNIFLGTGLPSGVAGAGGSGGASLRPSRLNGVGGMTRSVSLNSLSSLRNKTFGGGAGGGGVTSGASFVMSASAHYQQDWSCAQSQLDLREDVMPNLRKGGAATHVEYNARHSFGMTESSSNSSSIGGGLSASSRHPLISPVLTCDLHSNVGMNAAAAMLIEEDARFHRSSHDARQQLLQSTPAFSDSLSAVASLKEEFEKAADDEDSVDVTTSEHEDAATVTEICSIKDEEDVEAAKDPAATADDIGLDALIENDAEHVAVNEHEEEKEDDVHVEDVVLCQSVESLDQNFVSQLGEEVADQFMDKSMQECANVNVNVVDSSYQEQPDDDVLHNQSDVDDIDDDIENCEIVCKESLPDWLCVGCSVLVQLSLNNGSSKLANGWVRYVGETQFAAGIWVGVEIETADGRNDGALNGVRYFKCRARRGLFVRPEKLQPNVVASTSTSNKRKATQASTRSAGSTSVPSTRK